MSNLKRNAALTCTLTTLAKMGQIHFWTLTTPEKGEVEEISDRWHSFSTMMARHFRGRKLWRGLRVYERHPKGHGWHVHFVVPNFLPIALVRSVAEGAGFGRIHVWRDESADPEQISRYLLKYLAKGRKDPECLGTRIYGTFGMEGQATRQSDIEVSSPWKTIWQGVASCIVGFASMPWHLKTATVAAAHSSWVGDEIDDPAAYCAANLVPSSTTAILRLDGERACAKAELRAWERAERWAEIKVRAAKAFAVWNDKQISIRNSRDRGWKT